ncbi:MAG: hypothetical protein IJR40_08775 [Treponema sp.]|nr:hypothetical protein [Treponema sp.]
MNNFFDKTTRSGVNNDLGISYDNTSGKIKAAAVKEIKSAAALEVFHSVLLACNCNISKRAEKRLQGGAKSCKKNQKKRKKKPGRAGLPPCRGLSTALGSTFAPGQFIALGLSTAPGAYFA